MELAYLRLLPVVITMPAPMTSVTPGASASTVHFPALTTFPARTIFVFPLQAAGLFSIVRTLLHVVMMETPAPLIIAVPRAVAAMLSFSAMIITHVPVMPALAVRVYSHLTPVMMAILVPMTSVKLMENVKTKRESAMITIDAPKTSASMAFACLLQGIAATTNSARMISALTDIVSIL